MRLFADRCLTKIKPWVMGVSSLGDTYRGTMTWIFQHVLPGSCSIKGQAEADPPQYGDLQSHWLAPNQIRPT